MDISLVQGSGSPLVLNGTGSAAPLRAGKIDLSTPGKAVIECALDGTAAQIATFQQSVEKILMLGRLYAGLPGEDWAYLNVTLPDATVWRSPIAGSKSAAVPGPGSRSGGSQGFKIWLDIEDWWESGTLTEVPLSNHYGALQTGGLLLDNHQDGGPHDDFAQIAAATIQGDIPAPAVLTLSAVPNGCEFFIGQAVSNDVGSFTGIYEAEGYGAHNFAAATITALASCSSGNYVACAWNGAGAVTMGYSFSPTSFGARVFRPVLRLKDFVAGGEKIYMWFRLTLGTDLILDGEGVVLPTDRKLVAFPPMVLPPWSRGPAGFGWEPVSIYFVVQAEGAGAHVLNIDFFQMLPTEGWLRFYPVIPSMLYSMIRYDCGTGQNTRSTSTATTHVAEGPGIFLYPAVQQKIFVLSQNATDSAITTLNTLKIQYRARKRVL